MITGLLPKLGIGVLGLGIAVASGYGVYELARTKSIYEILRREHKVLKTEGNDDDEKWKELVDKYKNANNDKDPKKMKDLALEEGTGKDESNKKKLKEKCKNLLVSFYKDEKQQDYIDVKNWCTDSLLNKKV